MAYSPDDKDRIVTAVCRALSSVPPATVADACRAQGIDPSTLWDWTEASETFATMYARARDRSATAYDDEALATARASRPETAQSDRLLVDTLKWAAAKRRPREYGDKLDVTTKGESLADLHISALLAPRPTERINATTTRAIPAAVTDVAPVDDTP